MKMDELPIEISAIIGSNILPVYAYLALQVGDILLLDQKAEEGLYLKAGEKKLFRATAGLFETHKAVTIDERIYP
jgi:flagellar motor switch protein FliM